MSTSDTFVACSNCFIDEGPQLDAEQLGQDDPPLCTRCAVTDGRKLSSDRLATLARHFGICCINRVMLGTVLYAVHFGPVMGDA